MADVKLGLGPSLREKEKQIHELTTSKNHLEDQLDLTKECLKDMEDKCKHYADNLIECKTTISN